MAAAPGGVAARIPRRTPLASGASALVEASARGHAMLFTDAGHETDPRAVSAAIGRSAASARALIAGRRALLLP